MNMSKAWVLSPAALTLTKQKVWHLRVFTKKIVDAIKTVSSDPCQRQSSARISGPDYVEMMPVSTLRNWLILTEGADLDFAERRHFTLG
jgi:hypothetical protein